VSGPGGAAFRWDDLPADVQAELGGRGYDEAWLAAAGEAKRRTVRNLHAKLASLGLWRFVGREDDTERGNLHFRCSDVAGLRAAARRLRFASRNRADGYWEEREKRAFGSLHLKHFPGWPDDKVQAHVDRFGFWLRWWWWLAFPVPVAWMLLHLAVPESYRRVDRIRRILVRQGILRVPPE
jgi:hypothetical protein